ncbi:MAG: hypothetical protein AAF961_03890 [Planctomycetota bacterium]
MKRDHEQMRATLKVVVALAALSCAEAPARGDLVIEIGSAAVDLSAGAGTATASVDVLLSNTTGSLETAFGYTLLYDIAPVIP